MIGKVEVRMKSEKVSRRRREKESEDGRVRMEVGKVWEG